MSESRNLETAAILLLASIPCRMAGPVKFIPGGPFVSLLGDVLPAACALLAIWCAFSLVNHPLPKTKASAISVIVLATAMLASVSVGVIEFYLDPHARGAAFSL